MNRVSAALLSVVVGTFLVYLGFFLTGVFASKIDPQTLGVPAVAVYPLLMFMAWGLPAAILWFTIAAVARSLVIRSALAGSAIEAFILAGITLGLPFKQNELLTLATSLVWPVGFATLLSLTGSLLGSKVRGNHAQRSYQRL